MILVFKPTKVIAVPTSRDDPRIGSLLGTGSAAGPALVLIGFPCDQGVQRNGGRPGAAGAPDAIRRQLFKMTPEPNSARFREVVDRCVDRGNLNLSGDLESDQQLLGEQVDRVLREGNIPVVLGGGHETAYGHFQAYVRQDRDVEILNWDAHPDVRPLNDEKGHSGSPFRQAIRHPSGRCRRYTVAGLLPQSVAQSHLEFIEANGGVYLWGDRLSSEQVRAVYGRLRPSAMVSFDLDAVDQAFAPGVSAPAAGGLNTGLWLSAAFEAGRCPAVRSIDLVELNPLLDIDNRTARLAALTLWHFIRGVGAREQ